MKTPKEIREAHWQRIGEELLKQRNRPNYRIVSFEEYKKLEDDRNLFAAKIAEKHLKRAILKLREAINNKTIKGLLITEQEIAAILIALNEFGYIEETYD